MIRIICSIAKLNNASLVAFIRGLLVKLAASTFFYTPDVEKQSKLVGDGVDALEEDYSSDDAHRNSHAREERKKLEKEIPFLINMLEMLLTKSTKSEIEYVTLVEELGLKLKSKRGSVTRAFRVKQGSERNSAKVIAKGKSKVHQWQYTNDVDKFTNRITLEPTSVATIEVPNLKRGTYAFFHKAQGNAWEGPVYFLVTENADQLA